MSTLVTAIGLALVFEGLVFALAPRRIEAVLTWLVSLPVETRRLMGLTAVAAGVGVLWLARVVMG